MEGGSGIGWDTLHMAGNKEGGQIFQQLTLCLFF